jgi:hypothetical protein
MLVKVQGLQKVIEDSMTNHPVYLVILHGYALFYLASKAYVTLTSRLQCSDCVDVGFCNDVLLDVVGLGVSKNVLDKALNKLLLVFLHISSKSCISVGPSLMVWLLTVIAGRSCGLSQCSTIFPSSKRFYSIVR